jgi:hypothetical protein
VRARRAELRPRRLRRGPPQRDRLVEDQDRGGDLGRWRAQLTDRVVDRFGDSACINGGSPTDGFLEHGLHTKSPFTDFYASLSGRPVIEWIYMLSMAGIGLALILAFATRLAGGAGILWWRCPSSGW